MAIGNPDADTLYRVAVRIRHHPGDSRASCEVGVHAGAGIRPLDADRPLLGQEVTRDLTEATGIEEDSIRSAQQPCQSVRAVFTGHGVSRVTALTAEIGRASCRERVWLWVGW